MKNDNGKNNALWAIFLIPVIAAVWCFAFRDKISTTMALLIIAPILVICIILWAVLSKPKEIISDTEENDSGKDSSDEDVKEYENFITPEVKRNDGFAGDINTIVRKNKSENALQSSILGSIRIPDEDDSDNRRGMLIDSADDIYHGTHKKTREEMIAFMEKKNTQSQGEQDSSDDQG